MSKRMGHIATLLLGANLPYGEREFVLKITGIGGMLGVATLFFLYDQPIAVSALLALSAAALFYLMVYIALSTISSRRMDAIEKAIAEGRRDDVPKFLTDKWLADNTLFGPAAKVREGVAAWRAAGVHTPILVPSSAAGNQMKAIEEMFAAFG